MNAIETNYGGCRFRSRLEARWAVFFDQLSIKWQYEPQGFESKLGGRYLPDFFLPETLSPSFPVSGVYVEVKGSDELLRRDSSKIAGAIEYQATPIATHGILILGDVPRVDRADIIAVSHSFCFWEKGVGVTQAAWMRLGHGSWVLDRFGVDPKHWYDGNASEDLPEEASTEACAWARVSLWKGQSQMSETAPAYWSALQTAYTAARSSRFEHGQSGPAEGFGVSSPITARPRRGNRPTGAFAFNPARESAT